MNKPKLQAILSSHKLWLDTLEKEGVRANLQGANLQGADLDFSCLPLWCGSKGMKVDNRIAAQIAAHFCALDCDTDEFRKAKAAILSFALTSHRANDLGLITKDLEDGQA